MAVLVIFVVTIIIMKKALLITSVVMLSLTIQAQVTIKKSSVISAGHEFVQYSDTNKITIQQGGTGNLTWDFKNLKYDDSFTLMAMYSDWIPSISALVPGSDFILKEKGKEDYTFLVVNDSAIVLKGSAVDTGTGPLEVNNVGFNFLRYPITHDGNVYVDTVLMFVQRTYLGIVPGPGAPRIDSVRVEGYIAQEFRAIGHGKIEFPTSTMPDVLMVENLNVIFSNVYAQIGGNWTTINAAYAKQLGYDVGGDSSYRHMWWTDDNGKGLPVVQYEFDYGDATAEGADFSPAGAQKSNIKHANHVNVIVYPNPSANKIKFEGISNVNAQVQIYSLNGQLVIQTQLKEGVLDVSALNAGNYTVMVDAGNEIISTQIIKE